MQDCTDTIIRLREMARHIWNVYFKGLQRELQWDDVDDLQEITRIAFRAAFEMEPNDTPRLFEEPLSWLQVRPRQSGKSVKLLINPDARTTSGFFGNEEEILAYGSEMLFVSLFDFDLLGFRDMRYILVFVSRSESRPELEQHYALVAIDPHVTSIVLTGEDRPIKGDGRTG